METSKYIHISSKHSLEKIKKFLIDVLQYKSQESEIDEYDDFEYEWLHFFKEEDYKYYAGVYAEIYPDEEYFGLHFWSDIVNHSYYDIDYRDYTIEQLVIFFGAELKERDYWTDSDIEYKGLKREKAESGCYLAYQRFKSNMGKLNTFIFTKSFSKFPPITDARANLAHHPEIISNNLVIPFVIASLETYFRETFLALFKYSEKKKLFFKKYSNKYIDELHLVSDGQVDIDRVLVRYMSFQNISSIDENFKILDKNISVNNILYSKKVGEITLMIRLDRLLKLRHAIIHRSNFFSHYNRDYLDEDLTSINVLVDEFYKNLINLYHWQNEE